MSQEAIAWQAALPAETAEYLADLMEIAPFAPASAKPAALTLTARPPAPPPPDDAARLALAASGKAGLIPVAVPSRKLPLWLRAGSDDAAAALRSLNPDALPPIPYAPRRILEIGAGTGYRSVALALAYPDAEILCTEPDPARQRVNLLNTLPYRQISSHCIVLSTDRSRYGFAGRRGEAGHPALAREDAGPLTAVPLKNFLFAREWNTPDTVIVTPDAANDHLLRAPWPRSVRLLAVETGGKPLHEATAACFPDDRFLTVIEGDYVLMHRREAEIVTVPPRPVHVFDPETTPRALLVEDTKANPPGFFQIGAHGFRLHPNPPHARDARATIAQECRNFAELHVSLRVALEISKPVRFTIRVLAAGDDAELCRIEEVLKGGESRAASAPVSPYAGPCQVVFSTSMAEFEESCAGAWAEIVGAAFI